ncbi:TRZ/ATZ family hydrolase [Saccharophagus sp. K07]|mgnify:CR=1 FL=1|jgi:5-methylthioadenosine/S-adenosylhomocysteine deaminase|uniref:TRZ/ATZ family hydrolase n=1 Tax=Saccharophagus sp. K07 TaxID=2283636 RepID=UPI0016525F7E|nr:TRZ/ATZ family hydrolase [Saccharophagus sp. K07]MBC6907149.1 TRZ/ATZ family hydrolase [Saccharophagus sp. K07]
MPQPKPVDCIISARWILPITPAGKLFRDCSLVIHKGCIQAIRPSDNVLQDFTPTQHVQLNEHVLMPGLVNAHTHAAMSLLRGYADDLPLMRWLKDHIWPAEKRFVDADFVHDGTQLAMAEMLRTGTTCFSDMYFFPDAAAAAVHQAGMRAQITFPIMDFPTSWATDADNYIHKGLMLHDDYRSHPRIRIGFGPHAGYTVSDIPMRRIAVLAEELQAPVQIHLHETATEVLQAVDATGIRPIERLMDLGVLTPLTQCVHMTQLSDGDIDLLQESGASVIHCPESNLKLASGICPVQKLMNRGITIGLGTDGSASNNDLDMFGEITTAALVGKVAAHDAAALSAWQVLHMATLGGAKALGLDSQIGSLEVGKAADVIAVQLDELSSLPLYDLASHLTYSNRRTRVTHSWVAGKLLLRDGELTTLNETELRNRALHWQHVIQPPAAKPESLA